jgi:hypothetical protein
MSHNQRSKWLPRPAIELKVIVKEILSGTTDAHLMERYDLSAIDLENVFRELLDMRVINHIDVLAWSIFGNKVISTDHIRLFPRDNLEFALPIFEPSRPEIEGLVKNVSQRGLCVGGVAAKVNETRSFAIALDMARQVVSYPFEVRCRWTYYDVALGQLITGYSVANSSLETWQKIVKGVKLVRCLMMDRARA